MKRVKVVVNKNMVSHRNDPFFVKKNEEARKNIEKYKVIEQLLEWKRLHPTEVKKLHKEVIKTFERWELQQEISMDNRIFKDGE